MSVVDKKDNLFIINIGLDYELLAKIKAETQTLGGMTRAAFIKMILCNYFNDKEKNIKGA